MPSHPDNSITISFDQQKAVRNRDGLGLTAVPAEPGKRCRGCAAYSVDSVSVPGGYTCSTSAARSPLIRCCSKHARKDGTDIVWRPV